MLYYYYYYYDVIRNSQETCFRQVCLKLQKRNIYQSCFRKKCTFSIILACTLSELWKLLEFVAWPVLVSTGPVQLQQHCWKIIQIIPRGLLGMISVHPLLGRTINILYTPCISNILTNWPYLLPSDNMSRNEFTFQVTDLITSSWRLLTSGGSHKTRPYKPLEQHKS